MIDVPSMNVNLVSVFLTLFLALCFMPSCTCLTAAGADGLRYPRQHPAECRQRLCILSWPRRSARFLVRYSSKYSLRRILLSPISSAFSRAKIPLFSIPFFTKIRKISQQSPPIPHISSERFGTYPFFYYLCRKISSVHGREKISCWHSDVLGNHPRWLCVCR